MVNIVAKIRKRLTKVLLWNRLCNLGALIAVELAEECQCPAYIADPEVADEFMPESRYTGIPDIERKAIFHALGDNTVVGAGAVVTRSFPEGHCVIGGNPARKIKDI